MTATNVPRERVLGPQKEDLLVRKVRNSFWEEGTLEPRPNSVSLLWPYWCEGRAVPHAAGRRAASLLLPPGTGRTLCLLRQTEASPDVASCLPEAKTTLGRETPV